MKYVHYVQFEVKLHDTANVSFICRHIISCLVLLLVLQNKYFVVFSSLELQFVGWLGSASEGEKFGHPEGAIGVVQLQDLMGMPSGCLLLGSNPGVDPEPTGEIILYTHLAWESLRSPWGPIPGSRFSSFWSVNPEIRATLGLLVFNAQSVTG